MFFALAAALLQAATPPVASAPPRPSIITSPDWVRKPTGADLRELYPKAAIAKHLEGRAVIHCEVDAEGALVDCRVQTESPSGEGFGEAALAMSSRFRMRPMTRDGVPVTGGRVNIPINFAFPKVEALTLETALECYGATSAMKVALTNGEPAEVGWREAVQTLAGREHVPPAEVEAELSAARELADTPGAQERALPQLEHCRTIRSVGAVQALRTTPPPANR